MLESDERVQNCISLFLHELIHKLNVAWSIKELQINVC